MKRRPPILTRTAHLFPYTTLFLSDIHPERHDAVDEVVARGDGVEHRAHRGDLLVAFGERLGHLEGGHRGHGRNDRCRAPRSEEHTSELQSLMRISYAVFCFKKTRIHTTSTTLHSTRSSQYII